MKVSVTWLALVLAGLAGVTSARGKFDFVVSPEGRDGWTGTRARHDADYMDGPFLTFARAREAVRKLDRTGRKRPVIVMVRGGTYVLENSLVFTPADSGTAEAPVIYAAWPREKPVISGGIRAGGWVEQPDGCIRAKMPVSEDGKKWRFRQLFVNGNRRYRTRLPENGYFHIARGLSPSPLHAGKGHDRFGYAVGDAIDKLEYPAEVELLLFHNWFMSRMRIARTDRESRTVTLTGRTANAAKWADLSRGRRYIIENVREIPRKDGQWFLDSEIGMIEYKPTKRERRIDNFENLEVIAPVLSELVVFKGDIAGRKWVEYVTLRGLNFAHTTFALSAAGYSWAQAESNLGGAITAVGARNCTIEDCTIAHTGAYAIEWAAGCRDNLVERCTMYDLGAGGVKIGEMSYSAGTDDKVQGSKSNTGHNVVRDCTIAAAGRVHPAAVGIWIGHSSDNVIEHNDIYDLYYTAVSVGWSWGYGGSGAHHNRIAYNHMHTLGQSVLTDMGGIYTLGVSPGTVLEGNVMHDIDSYDYGGWGIYFDEGSTGIVARNNLVYRTKSGGFHQHYGKDNVVENNIFAFGREAQLIRTRGEGHRSFSLKRNIVLARGAPILGGDWSSTGFEMDENLYWDTEEKSNGPRDGVTWEQWRKRGNDGKSVIANPKFRNPKKGDFRLKKKSPALAIGFKPFDFSKAGRRGKKPDLAPGVRAYPAGKK